MDYQQFFVLVNKKPLISICQFCSKRLKDYEVMCPYCGSPITTK